MDACKAQERHLPTTVAAPPSGESAAGSPRTERRRRVEHNLHCCRTLAEYLDPFSRVRVEIPDLLVALDRLGPNWRAAVSEDARHALEDYQADRDGGTHPALTNSDFQCATVAVPELLTILMPYVPPGHSLRGRRSPVGRMDLGIWPVSWWDRVGWVLERRSADETILFAR